MPLSIRIRLFLLHRKADALLRRVRLTVQSGKEHYGTPEKTTTAVFSTMTPTVSATSDSK